MRLLLTGADENGLTEEEAELAALYRGLPPLSKRLVLGLSRLAADNSCNEKA
jgi:hypothetical protein